MLRSRLLLPIALGFVISNSSNLFAAGPPQPGGKLSPDAVAASPDATLNVIIQYKHDPGVQDAANASGFGALVKSHLHSIHALTAAVPQTLLNRLAGDPNIAYISIDRPLAAREAVNITAPEYTTEPINAPAVWAQGYIGTSIGVAVIDSGIQPVQDLNTPPAAPPAPGQPPAPPAHANPPGPPAPPAPAQVAPGTNGRIAYSQNFVTGQNDALDHFGHGTHVAGLIAGNGWQSTGAPYFRTFYGAAPNATLINLRALDQNGAGTDSSVIAAIEEAIALQSTYNIRVINLSLGRPVYESYTQDPLCQAVEQAWKAGIVVVVAAGNDGRDLNLNAEGYGTINAPGNDPYVITVGAMNTMETPSINDDIIASYSSKGPSFIDDVVKPDIVAPGNLVTSLEFGGDPLAQQNPTWVTPHLFYMNHGDNNASANYFPLSGTSMAAAVTSGAIADLLQAVPSLTPDQVKALLMVSADRNHFPQTSSVTDQGVTYNANYDVFTVGAGYLDINAALANALSTAGSIPSGTAMSPIAAYDPATGNTTAVVDQTALWGKTSLFGASNVYGANAFVTPVGGSSAVWGQTALWGKSDPDGFSSLFGSTALWGKGTPDAATALWGKTTPDAATAMWGK